MLRLAIPTCLAVLAFAVPAAAAPVLDAGTGQYTNPPTGPAATPVSGSATASPIVPRLWAAAVRYWGGAPAGCAEGVQIRLSTEDPEATPEDDGYNGWVYDDELCAMYLNVRNESWPIRARNARLWCDIVTHEVGHMLGLDHSPDRRSIMYGGWIPSANPHCKAFARKARSRRGR